MANIMTTDPMPTEPEPTPANLAPAQPRTTEQGLTRRSFIGLAGAAAATVATGPLVGIARPGVAAARPTSAAAAPRSSAAAQGNTIPATPGILVLVTLYGGNDGLNMLIPLDAGPYITGRGTLAYQAAEAIPIGEGFGLHPSMTGLKGIWDRRQLAIVRGVGYPSPSRSHFRSQDIWSSAVPGRYERTGWIGRWYDKVGTNPLGLAAIANAAPQSFTGTIGNGIVVDTIGTRRASGTDFAAATAILNAPDDSLGALAARVRTTGNDLGRVDQVFGPLLASQPPTPIEAATLESGYTARSANVLTDQLNIVARLIKADAPTRVYAVSLGGFDTHANERANHANLMGILDRAMSGFVQVMSADPRGMHVTVAVTSEFGRRLAANGSGGTDHGTAAPVLIAGPSVKGGFYGDAPSLTDLDQGDLKYTTDFRSIYATLLAGVLGADPLTALDPGFPNLGFI